MFFMSWDKKNVIISPSSYTYVTAVNVERLWCVRLYFILYTYTYNVVKRISFSGILFVLNRQ